MTRFGRWRATSPWVRRGLAGFVLGLSIASCDDYGPEQFNLDAAGLICDVERACGEDLLDPVEIDFGLGTDDEPSCFGDKHDDFEVCRRTCEFHGGRAQRCIDRLEAMVEDCDVLSLGPCRRVYDSCETAESCNPWDCSVGSDGDRGGPWALALVMLGLTGRRRRTRA